MKCACEKRLHRKLWILIYNFHCNLMFHWKELKTKEEKKSVTALFVSICFFSVYNFEVSTSLSVMPCLNFVIYKKIYFNALFSYDTWFLYVCVCVLLNLLTNFASDYIFNKSTYLQEMKLTECPAHSGSLSAFTQAFQCSLSFFNVLIVNRGILPMNMSYVCVCMCVCEFFSKCVCTCCCHCLTKLLWSMTTTTTH